MILWFTGQPGSGKNTLCKELAKQNDRVIHIDGDDIRDVLDNKDYSEKGRRKNLQLAIDMATVMDKKGDIYLVSLILIFSKLTFLRRIFIDPLKKIFKDLLFNLF